MLRCPACREVLPDDARFCGLCGFRLTPIPVEVHRRLRDSYAEAPQEAPPALESSPAPPRADSRPPPGEQGPSERGFDPLPALSADTGAEAREGDTLADEALAHTIAAPVQPSGAEGEPPVLLTRRKAVPEPAASGSPRLVVMDGVALADTAQGSLAARQGAEGASALSSAVEADPGPHRRARRFAMKVDVSYGSQHNFYTGFVENLSSGGLFVATHEAVAVGEAYEITFSVPGINRSCTALCEVRWVREYNPAYPDMVPGMGLKFLRIDSDVKAAIELFIRHREPIFYDDGG